MHLFVYLLCYLYLRSFNVLSGYIFSCFTQISLSYHRLNSVKFGDIAHLSIFKKSTGRELKHFQWVPAWQAFEREGKGAGGLGKAVLGASETRGAREEGGRENFPPSLLARPSRFAFRVSPFPFPFKRLPRRLSQTPLYGHPLNVDISLSRTVCSVPGERKPLHFL